ncbi:Calcium permeable stress-gated cation channel 1 [Meyerozyma sp. JA9]|nr:Calcium permeable stress-gated cation channel 1 [Meyerozyma sp. JA9]
MNDTPADRMGPQRVFGAQLALCLWIGVSSFVLFCFLRYKWPHIYAVRTFRNHSGSRLGSGIRPLPKKIFGWLAITWSITDDEVLQWSGLDAYVFLAFFRMGIRIFSMLAVLAVFILSPIRYYFTGNYDKDDVPWSRNTGGASTSKKNPDLSDDFPNYLWVYSIFVYVFSVTVYIVLYDTSRVVLRTRQKYLAAQDSITDRTIRLEGIPKKLLDPHGGPERLRRFIENLGIGTVTDIKMIYDWSPFQQVFARRNVVLHKLEELYAHHYGLVIDIYRPDTTPKVLPRLPIDSVLPSPSEDEARGQISALAAELTRLNSQIREMQLLFDPSTCTFRPGISSRAFHQTTSAFITMDSVASAQMAAQAVLDPRQYKLMVTLAPAPKDINWSYFALSYYRKLLRSYVVTFVIVLSYVFIFFLVTPITALLNVKTITKFWPALGELISKSTWATTFVTGILPPLLVSLLNVSLPYFYKYLSTHQGFASNSDIELSTLSKNFFFVFFNLFLIFNVTGTFWDYLSYMRDTTKLAYQLAEKFKEVSLFYVDLILLQGLAMFPVRLLQLGDVVVSNVLGRIFLLRGIILKTPRDYRFYYYTPPIFDFGIQVPQHIFVFIIILTYSVVSTKIVVSGLVYFTLGYFVYKYQLVYNFVHPPHSTGKVWPMIFRRIVLGLILFQLFMCGTLALEGAVLLAVLCAPLIIVTLVLSWNFERFYRPLSNFIALGAIQNPYDFDKMFGDDTESKRGETPAESPAEAGGEVGGETPAETESESAESAQLLPRSLRRRKSTVDEDREQFTDYTAPYLLDPLHGPWVGFDGEYISMVEYSGADDLENGDTSVISTREEEMVVRRKLRLSEWE